MLVRKQFRTNCFYTISYLRKKKNMSLRLKEQVFTLQSYLEMERQSPDKHEFYNGNVQPVAGANPIHNKIAGRVISELITSLDQKKKEYHVLTSDTKIYIPEFQHILYPDAVVICEKIELMEGSTTVVTNPLLIVEVLSPSTEAYDRSGKFIEYKTLPSFKEYVLIRQDQAWVQASFQVKPGHWVDTTQKDISRKINLRSIECELSLTQIYKGIEF